MFELNKIAFEAPIDKGSEPSDPKAEFRTLASEIKNLVGRQDTEAKASLEKINDRLDSLEFDYQAYKNAQASASGEKGSEHVDTFRTALFKFAQGDRHTLAGSIENKSFEVKSGYHPMAKSNNIVRFDVATGGALLLPAELSREIMYNAVEQSAITRLVKRSMTSNPQKIVTLRVGTPGIQWVDEEGAVAKGKMTYRKVTLTPHKAAARYGMSIEQEQDSAYDVRSEISRAYAEDFEVGVGSAVASGDGVNKPKGMVGELKNFNTASLSITTDLLIRFQESLLEKYQANADWLFTRKTRAYIRTLLLSATNGLQYTWEPDFTRRTPTLMLGSPVNIAREGDLAGEFSGNFAAGQVPILYGDFKQAYELTMRTDMYMIDDPYSESDSFVRNLSIMSRVDGQPLLTEAAAQFTITAP